jgi:hypothetical protein
MAQVHICTLQIRDLTQYLHIVPSCQADNCPACSRVACFIELTTVKLRALIIELIIVKLSYQVHHVPLSSIRKREPDTWNEREGRIMQTGFKGQT